MCKTIIVAIIYLFTAVASQAQEGLRVSYQVKFNDEFDRGRRDRSFTGTLLISQGRSRYFMVAKDAFEPSDDNDSRFTPDTSHLVYSSQSEGMLISQEFGFDGQSFFVSDSLYPMSWEILAEEKKLGGMSCVKAKCIFRGRKYIAWFAPDIPIPQGPWKMGGLPGLIVDLQDVDENLVIQLASIQPYKEAIILPTRVRYTINEHATRLKALIRKMQEGSKVTATGDCLTCTGQSTFQFFLWEKLFP